MKLYLLLLMNRVVAFFIILFFTANASAQQALPVISARNVNNKIIVSWVNEYTKPITTLNIQRSYDSLRNYSTIGSVLSPQSRENGYVDAAPPYSKMYYRVFIAFEGGTYVITPSVRPVKDVAVVTNVPLEKYPWIVSPSDPKPLIDTALIVPVKPGVTYPSQRIFTARDNNIVIYLPEVLSKKYSVKFYNENEKFLFELTKLKEEYLILEKVNFVRPGWFRFEIYENGELLENNKFQITRDPKKL